MNEYKITVEQILTREFIVKAASEREAEDKARAAYDTGNMEFIGASDTEIDSRIYGAKLAEYQRGEYQHLEVIN